MQLDLDRNWLATHETPYDAATAVGKRSANNILGCCSGKQDTTHGYIWKYAEGDRKDSPTEER